MNCEVTVAASDAAAALLQAEFPQLHFLNLPAYNITYSRDKRWLPFKILIQIPKILKAVKAEHVWLKKLLLTHNFNAVISDNRYGFYNINISSVFITHQLQVRTSLNLLTNIMRRLLYKRINNFNECWVPDYAGSLNIAGRLSHPPVFPIIPVKYLGPLSRFKQNVQIKIAYKYLFIISGPEPQRTIFEKTILAFVKTIKDKCIIVRGKPEKNKPVEEIAQCKIYNHLNTKDLAAAFNASEFIVSRCGYTSVMEILSLQKKSILIPTPAQTEQEYLAKRLMQQKWCYAFLQHQNFSEHLINAQSFIYDLPQISTTSYKSILADFISRL